MPEGSAIKIELTNGPIIALLKVWIDGKLVSPDRVNFCPNTHFKRPAGTPPPSSNR